MKPAQPIVTSRKELGVEICIGIQLYIAIYIAIQMYV